LSLLAEEQVVQVKLRSLTKAGAAEEQVDLEQPLHSRCHLHLL
jgi:hypothetical protein